MFLSSRGVESAALACYGTEGREFEVLAATGLRRSELLALEGRHLVLNGENPCVRVRQRVRRQKGAGLVVGATKSRYSRRDVPISTELADRLRALRVADDELVFATRNDTPFDGDNLSMRVLGPACSEAGVEWAGFHTFRHTVASLLFASGRNVVQVQRFLGHHSPAFTLEVYVHLFEDSGVGGPLVLNHSVRETEGWPLPRRRIVERHAQDVMQERARDDG